MSFLRRAFHPRQPLGLMLHLFVVGAGSAQALAVLGLITLGPQTEGSAAYQSGARVGSLIWVLVGLFAAQKLRQAWTTPQHDQPQGPPAHATRSEGLHAATPGAPPSPTQVYAPAQPYAPQAYPPQAYAAQAYPAQAYAPQTYPPQAYAPQAYPPQAHPAPGVPPTSPSSAQPPAAP